MYLINYIFLAPKFDSLALQKKSEKIGGAMRKFSLASREEKVFFVRPCAILAQFPKIVYSVLNIVIIHFATWEINLFLLSAAKSITECKQVL